MFYDRKIKYLDYLENGVRVRGAGYVKMEVRDGSLRMELTVTGLHPTDSFTRDIFLYAGETAKLRFLEDLWAFGPYVIDGIWRLML